MNDITITPIRGELRADSRIFAPKLDLRHRQIMDNIRKYESEFRQLGVLPFETEKPTGPEGGRPQEFALLNEDQSYFLLTLSRNSDKVVAAKLALVKAFRDARAQLASRDIARLEGKAARQQETAAIADLIRYATAQGSEHAEKYYLSISRMTNDLLGIESGRRDSLPADALDRLRLAETMIDVAIRDGIRAGLHYKQIYRVAKDRVSGLLPLIGGQP